MCLQHDEDNEHCSMLYIKVVKRVILELSSQEKTIFFYLFNFVFI